MNSFPLAEAKNKLSELVERVNRGEEITITRHDREIARLVPASKRNQADALRAISVMRTFRKQTVLNPLSSKKTLSIRELIATGRKY